MKRNLIALLTLLSAGALQAQILRYDLTGLPGTGTAPTTANATTVAPGITALTLSRGAGINGAVLANGFSSDDWNNPATDSGSTSPTLANAILTGDFYQCGFTVNGGNLVSLSTLNFSLRRSAVNAASNFEWQYSTDGFSTPGNTISNFMYLGRSSGTAGSPAPYSWMTTDTPGQNNGNPIGTIDLSSIPGLQNIAEGVTVTFRLYAYGAATGAADSNTVALGRVDGPTFGGSVVAVPEPTALAVIGVGLLALTFRRKV